MENTTEHFNKLSEAEAERLALLSEELAEVQQVIGKILRHGYESHNPFDENKTTNRSLLEGELGDAQYAIQLMCLENDVSNPKIQDYAKSKSSRVKKYLHHNL